MEKLIINPQKMTPFKRRNFMACVTDEDGNVIFYPYMVTNVAFGVKKIVLTLYDLIQENNIETELDKLSKGFWIFKPKVVVTLMRLDAANEEVYRVVYSGCKLKEYHNNGLRNDGDDVSKWYLELTIGKKEIITNDEYDVDMLSTNDKRDSHNDAVKNKFIEKTHILKKSNQTLSEAKENVFKYKKINETEAMTKSDVKASNNAKSVPKDFSLKDLEEKLISKLNDLENNVNI